jgi:urease subunit gamma/beta
MNRDNRSSNEIVVVVVHWKTTDGDSGSYPGEIYLKDAQPIMINGEHDSIFITMINTSTELISIGSHYHLVEANRHLSFDRTIAYGMRLVRILVVIICLLRLC